MSYFHANEKPWFCQCFNKRLTLFFMSGGKYFPPGSFTLSGVFCFWSGWLLSLKFIWLYGWMCLYEIFTSIKRIKLKFVHHDFMYGFYASHGFTHTQHIPKWGIKSIQLLATHTYTHINAYIFVYMYLKPI